MDFDRSIFKAYDIRGIVPDQLTTDIAYAIGNSLAGYLKPKSIAVGRDMRISSEEMFEALSIGILDRGVDVVDLGMISTDALYFAVGKFGYDGGVMITASHNPAEYNGFKVCRSEAVPLSGNEGLDVVADDLANGQIEKSPNRGSIARKDISRDFSEHALSFIDPTIIKPTPATAWPERCWSRYLINCPARLLRCIMSRTVLFPITRPIRSSRLTWSICKKP